MSDPIVLGVCIGIYLMLANEYTSLIMGPTSCTCILILLESRIDIALIVCYLMEHVVFWETKRLRLYNKWN